MTTPMKKGPLRALADHETGSADGWVTTMSPNTLTSLGGMQMREARCSFFACHDDAVANPYLLVPDKRMRKLTQKGSHKQKRWKKMFAYGGAYPPSQPS